MGAIAAVGMLALAGVALAAKPYEPANDPLTRAVVANLDMAYARSIIEELSSYGDAKSIDGSDLGFRAAGSAAGIQSTDFIEQEMRSIGLVDVVQEPFPVDVWEFHGGYLDVPGVGLFPVASYAGSPPTDGPITAEIVWAGGGRRQAYENLDVDGKIVMVNFNANVQWVNTLAGEAAAHGAKALVLTTYTAPYGQTPTSLSCHDSAGLTAASPPVLSISKEAALAIYLQLEKISSEGGDALEATAFTDIRIAPKEASGEGYNVVGVLPGRHYGTPEDEIVVIGDHSDAWFFGGMDDNSGVAATLVLAKALKQATEALGVKLDRTIVFTTHDAEEYGLRGTYADWAYGAWYQITQAHPEWVGRAVAYVNFELMGQAGGPLLARSSKETFGFVKRLLHDHPTLTYGATPMKYVTNWTDAWTFDAAGVASIDFVSAGSDYDRYYYHTQFDTVELIDFDWLLQECEVFADLAIRLSRAGLVPYDFGTTAKDLDQVLTDDTKFYDAITARQLYRKYGIDPAPNLDRALAASGAFSQKTAALAAALSRKGAVPPERLPEVNRQLMSIRAVLGQSLTALDEYDTTRFPHEQGARDLVVMDEVIDTLSSPKATGGDITTAMNEISNWVGLNWWAVFLSREPYYDYLARTHDGQSWDSQTKRGAAVDLYEEYQALAALAYQKPLDRPAVDAIVAGIRAELYDRAFPNIEQGFEYTWRGLEEANAQIDALIASL